MKRGRDPNNGNGNDSGTGATAESARSALARARARTELRVSDLDWATPRNSRLDKVSALHGQLFGPSSSSSSSSSSSTGTGDDELDMDNYLVVEDLNPEQVASRIEALAESAVRSILAGDGFEYHVPNRAKTEYLEELDQIVLRKDKQSVRKFVNLNEVRKVAVTTRVLDLVHNLLTHDPPLHSTKRDLFYTDVKLFKDQKQSDDVLDDIACMLGCTRNSLNIVASEKGLVVGRLAFTEAGDLIDCTRMGISGKAIPPHIDKVENIVSDAKFILIVEKDAAFQRLAEDRFYNDYPCIIITAKGQPDLATRLFLRRLQSELRLPALGLVDSDPYGLKILSVYMSGSKAMSHDAASLTTRGIVWLGIRPSDLDRYDIPAECRLPMTASDIATGQKLLEADFIKKNPEWVKELELMIKTREKAEIQALSSRGVQYLSQVYLPSKLRDGDWI